MNKNDAIFVRFELRERPNRTWDLFVISEFGRKITAIGPLSWDEVVKECNRCQRLREEFIDNFEKSKNNFENHVDKLSKGKMK